LIDSSAEQVGAGEKLVALAGETMEKVVSSVQHVTDIVAEISSASAEQSAGIEQINQAIVEMDNMTQQNSALVEQASAAAQAMNEQAAGLAQIVSVFKVGAVARHAAPTPRTAPAPAVQRRLAR